VDLERSKTLLERLHIRSLVGQMVPFRFNPNQQIFFKKISEQYKRTGRIRAVIDKARRVGVSSVIDSLAWCYCQAHPNRNAQIVAHLSKSSNALFRVPRDLAKEFPYSKLDNIQERRIIFPHRKGKSLLEVATAGTPSAGRGETLNFLHLSEAAFYPGEDSFIAMMNAVSQGPDTMVFVESTANGREGPGEAFANFWDDAVEGHNDFVHVFLSWLDDPSCVGNEDEAEDAPRDDLEKELMGPRFKATRAQVAWARRTKAAQCRNLEPLFLQEFPHCYEVSFQVSGDPAFPRDELTFARGTVTEPVAKGALRRLGNSYEFKEDSRGSLFIWELPYDEHGRKRDDFYYIGADAAAGLETGDFAAYTVFNGTTGEVAARFSDRINPEVLAEQLDMAGRFYNRARVNPELTGGLGRWTLKFLRDVYFYPNIHTWKGKDDRKRGKGASMMLGFETNQATRRQLFDAFRIALRAGMNGLEDTIRIVAINDEVLMQQMETATIKDWSWDVRYGHDDVLFASFLSVLTCFQSPPPRFAMRNKKPEDDNKDLLAVLNPRTSGAKELWEANQLRFDLMQHWKNVRTAGRRNRLNGI
jgi:hypothetical protein